MGNERSVLVKVTPADFEVQGSLEILLLSNDAFLCALAC